jgi:predicted AlkP superfamily pyrophosphatase or phosphodiesterase
VKKLSKKLIVLSVDSLFHEEIEYIRTLPNFKMLFEKGSYAEGMRTIYPSLTYPAHASIITGVNPKFHGICHNEKVEVGNDHPDWYWYHKDIKVDTLIDVAKKNGLSTSVVLWPVMGGCKNVDYLMTEIWAEKPDDDPRPVFENSSSKILMDTIFEKHRHHLRWKTQPYLDEFGICCSEDIIKTYKPDVMFIHLAHLDHTRHAHGLHNEQVNKALEDNDKWFGRIVQATKDAGVFEDTNFVVLGDHGHLEVNQVICPNIIFAENDLIKLDEEGNVISYDAYCHSASLSSQVVLKDPTNKEVKEKVLRLLEEMQRRPELGIEQIITKEEADKKYQVTGPFDYILEGTNGTSFHNQCTGEVIRKPDNSDYKFSKASHGHLPHKGAQPAFIACGPRIKEGIVVGLHSVLDEAPTFAEILGITMNDVQGKAIKEIIK